MGVLVTNNAWGELAVAVNRTDTSLLLSGGQGDRFPSAVDGVTWFYVTLVDEEDNLEIVRCTARSADTLTVVRGVDGTSPRAFREGSRVELRPVAALFGDLASKVDLEDGLKKLHSTISTEHSADVKQLTQSIANVEETYLTQASFKEQMDSTGTSNADTFLSKTDASGQYVFKTKADTRSGDLTQKGTLRVEGYLDVVNNNIHTNKDIWANGVVGGRQLRASSDIRLKDHIVNFRRGEALGLIAKLCPVHFDWKSNGAKDIGLIAQEVARVLPELVAKDEKGLLSINYAGLTAIALAACADLAAELERMKDEKAHG
jgi:hypothetical protein